MNRLTLMFLCFIPVFVSSCMSRQGTDATADAALGLEVPEDTAEAQQELDRIQENQHAEQKQQLDRQIRDTINQPPVATTTSTQ